MLSPHTDFQYVSKGTDTATKVTSLSVFVSDEVKVLRSCTPETKSDNVARTHTASCNNDDSTEFNLSDIVVDLSNSKLTEDQKVLGAEVNQK